MGINENDFSKENQEANYYQSKSFELFDKIHQENINHYDMVMLLKKYTDNYDIELLNSLSYDISLYLSLKHEDKIDKYSDEDIQNKINSRKDKGLRIPMIKPYIPEDPTDDEKTHIKEYKYMYESRIDLEELFYPFEFLNITIFQSLINNKISQLEPQTHLVNRNIKFKISQTQLVELTKSLIENGNIQGKQKDIITAVSTFFDTAINNPDKLITDIKKRNIGSETLFLDKLKSSLYDYITIENKR